MKLTVHAVCVLLFVPVSNRCWCGVHSGLWAEAVPPYRPDRAARLLCALAGRQARLIQALRAVLGLQAPQAHLILALRPQ